MRLVAAEQLRGKDHVPGQTRVLRHVHEQRDVAVGQRTDDVTPLQPGKTFDGVPPTVQAMPTAVEPVAVSLVEPLDAEPFDQFIKGLAMKVIEVGPRDSPRPDLVLGRLVAAPPRIDQAGPVGPDAPLTPEALELFNEA